MILTNNKVSGIIFYVCEYFIAIFIVLLTTDILRSFPLIVNSATIRYSIIGGIMFALFTLFNAISSLLNEKKTSLVNIVINSLIDVTLLIPIFLFIRNKRIPTRSLSPNVTFILGISYFFLIFIGSFIFAEIVYHIPHLLNILVGSGQITFTNTSQFQYPALIIIHNSVFMAEILIGSFFLLLPTLGAILLDNLITTPILLYLITTGHYNSILPQLLLELIGTSLATGSAFLIFYTFFTSMTTRKRTYDFIRTMSYSKKVILFGIILSAYAFILAWPIESELVLFPNINSPNWFHAIYLFDVIVIIIYAAFLYDILVRKVFSLQKLILPSLWAGIFLFVVLAGGGEYEQTLTFELLLLGFVSLIYPTLGLAKSLSIHKNAKSFANLLIGNSFSIHKSMGKSMRPTLSSGDYIITYLTDDEFLFKLGDIVTYEPLLAYSPMLDSRYVTHRIIELREDNLVTKGDNLKKADPPIKPFRIIGVAIASLDTESFLCSSLTEREDLLEIVKKVERTVVQGKANFNNIGGNIKKLYFSTILFPFLISLVLPILFLFA